jgi:UDP-N-acetylmuramate: L-alanyl-gamma-D-glutamyl-meso-diaminopimelate ligase
VILGMHARADNPELVHARELGLKIFSYPEFLYEQSKNKTRIVVGGSHGKTTITAMLLHVLQHCGIDSDFMVGAKLEGFDVMVRLTDNARFMVIEGDEYLTSAMDPRPKFHLYKPLIALVSGIAWDHMNVFPTFESYVEQFSIFLQMVPDSGTIVFCDQDDEVVKVVNSLKNEALKLPYGIPDFQVVNGITKLNTVKGEIPLQVFGKHNLMNLEGARLVCNRLGISNMDYYSAISTFKGAASRLEMVYDQPGFTLFRDFAHAPSKLKATVAAVKEQYPERSLIACFELHTFSSLSKGFLPQYAGSMEAADRAIVFFSPHALALKKLLMLDKDDVRQAFKRPDLEVVTDKDELYKKLSSGPLENVNLLMMSSGNFDGIDFGNLGKVPGSTTD